MEKCNIYLYDGSYRSNKKHIKNVSQIQVKFHIYDTNDLFISIFIMPTKLLILFWLVHKYLLNKDIKSELTFMISLVWFISMSFVFFHTSMKGSRLFRTFLPFVFGNSDSLRMFSFVLLLFQIIWNRLVTHNVEVLIVRFIIILFQILQELHY